MRIVGSNERKADMETWDAIRARRNVRTYLDRPIEPGDLERILDAGRRTPSSKNEQRWDFVVVTQKDALERLSHVWQGARHVPGSAATIALVAPESDVPRVRESIQYDLGQVTMSMMIAAADLGIGSGHSSVHDQSVAREVLGFPEGHFCAWLIGLGYPADRDLRPIQRPSRRSLDDVAHYERW
jgi:nitroreductase